jgi:lipopolysaccharide transport system ATP-binding protein
VKLTGVTLDYTIYSVRAQSLRNLAMNMAVGGKLYRNQGDVTVMRAVSNIHIEAEEGDRIALVGHNGSGKTTLLRLIAGIYAPTQGVVDVQGSMTSMLALGAGMDLDATGLQNIKKMGAMRMIPKKVVEQRIDAIAEFSELGHFLQLPVKTYSSGMVMRLMFSVATEFDADILVMDEWLSAGDAAFVAKATDRMETFVDRAKILIIGTHNFGLVKRVCNKVLALENGASVFYGPVDEWERFAGVAA